MTVIKEPNLQIQETSLEFDKKTMSFNVNLSLHDNIKYETLIDIIIAELEANNINTTLRKEALICIIANLARSANLQRKTSIPLNTKYFAQVKLHTPEFFSYKIMREMIDILIHINFLCKDKGYIRNGKKVATKIYPSKLFIDTFKNKELDKLGVANKHNLLPYRIREDSEVIIFKDENKVPISLDDLMIYEDKAVINELESIQIFLQDYNSFSENFAISVDFGNNRERFLLPQLVRIFNNGSILNGGRFYRADYQNIKSEYRTTIHINDISTIERDFQSIHMNMLYHEYGLNYDGDPYSILGTEHRGIFKILSLIVLNTTLDKAKGAFEKELRDNQELLELYNESQLSFEICVDYFQKEHHQISDMFFSGCSVILQKKDSDIALRVLDHFMQKGILCLTVHDSFIVQKEYENELVEVMQKSYKEVMKTDYDIPIK